MSNPRRRRLLLAGAIAVAAALSGYFAWEHNARGKPGVWRNSGSAPGNSAKRAPAWLKADPDRVQLDAIPAGTERGAVAPAGGLHEARLKRAEDTLETYRRVTRYPHDSRPIAEHPDQVYPNQPVVEEKRLYKPGDKEVGKIRLRTSQERIFVVGAESVLFLLQAFGEDDAPLPLRVMFAGASDAVPGNPRPTRAPVSLALNDDGRHGDATAGDTIYSARFTPAQQGFGDYAGQVRVEMLIDVGGQTGYVYFDLYLTPDPPATWTGAVREAIEDGSLALYFGVDVKRPGHYVAHARVDGTGGTPLALVSFNGELAVGRGEMRMLVFGKLVVDSAPRFPLVVRDIDGFLLKPDVFPDRELMPRIPGRAHTTRSHAVERFSAAEWQSEERDRYLAELGNDVRRAREALIAAGVTPALPAPRPGR